MSKNKKKARVKTAKKRKTSSTRWLERQLNDPYVDKAKKDGYRSRAAYKLVGLHTDFTAGGKEGSAWTIHVGDTAPQAAGVIHTDFEKGYIRAQTIAFDDFIQFKGEQGAKDAGKMRAEGKDYVVKDGDVMNFLFSS